MELETRRNRYDDMKCLEQSGRSFLDQPLRQPLVAETPLGDSAARTQNGTLSAGQAGSATGTPLLLAARLGSNGQCQRRCEAETLRALSLQIKSGGVSDALAEFRVAVSAVRTRTL
ncbi:hypothetical protein NDU88_005117 [Pleurodeles waltl]|uniref:Uncharacterized protein n=1 Tax=Pleurodeles waltl TaxID=8319 RepID=A0AAV7SKR3_PLEWA|nr:hypothetical protein NDU88_005117 [Pleurodeles waltl]